MAATSPETKWIIRPIYRIKQKKSLDFFSGIYLYLHNGYLLVFTSSYLKYLIIASKMLAMHSKYYNEKLLKSTVSNCPQF